MPGRGSTLKNCKHNHRPPSLVQASWIPSHQENTMNLPSTNYGTLFRRNQSPNRSQKGACVCVCQNRSTFQTGGCPFPLTPTRKGYPPQKHTHTQPTAVFNFCFQLFLFVPGRSPQLPARGGPAELQKLPTPGAGPQVMWGAPSYQICER